MAEEEIKLVHVPRPHHYPQIQEHMLKKLKKQLIEEYGTNEQIQTNSNTPNKQV